MSGASWRFTDASGVERTVPTEELRAVLASGKLPPSTLVWREGMGEWQAAFTMPELSSAAIAAARRGSIPPAKETTKKGPGDPAKRSVPPPPLRPAPRGVARTLTGIEPPAMLEAMGLLKRPVDEPTSSLLDAPTTDGGSEAAPETRQLGSLGDSEDWEQATDLIPRAPGLPKDLRPLGLRPAPHTPPSDPGSSSHAEGSEPKRTTLLGFGQKPSIGKVPSGPGGGPAIRAVAVSGHTPPGAAPTSVAARSKPPPPLPAPTSSAAVKKRSEPPPAPKRLNRTLEMDVPKAGPPNRPPVRAGRITAPGGAQAVQQEPRGSRPMSKHPPPPLKPKAPQPAADATPAPSAASAAAVSPVNEQPTKASHEIAAAHAATALASPDAARPAATHDSPTAISVPPTTQSSPTSPAAAATKGEPAKKPVARETTEIMIREAEPKVDLPPRSSHRTLEMAIDDHSSAAAKDPAPPESKKARSTTERPKAAAKKEDASEGEKATRKRTETTDATASRDARDSDVPSPRKRSKKGKGALEVPMSAVLAVSSAWVIGLVVFFFVGRVSGFKSAGKIPIARSGITDAFLLNAALPVAAGPAPVVANEPKPCWVTRQPSRWAPKASKSVSFDMRPRDNAMLLGFAVDDKSAVGLKVDPKLGKFEEIFKKEATENIVRVSPLATASDFYVGAKADRTFLPVDAPQPFFLSFEKGQIGTTETTDGTVTPLWSLEGEELVTSEQVLPVADGYALSFRRGNDIDLGLFGADRNVRGAIAKLDTKGKNGKPRIGTNGAELAVTFAARADENDETPWKLHIARAALGLNPAVLELELPPGGPGGDAIAPDIIGLKDGRWLLMWTEGKSGERAIRAQTYDPAFEPIGDPIALSPPAGSFGQALLGVVGTYTTVVFLQAADEGFEMWGAVLQCGS